MKGDPERVTVSYGLHFSRPLLRGSSEPQRGCSWWYSFGNTSSVLWWHPAGTTSERRLGVITGSGPQDGGNEPVWAKLLRRAADAARLTGAILQSVWYALKIW